MRSLTKSSAMSVLSLMVITFTALCSVAESAVVAGGSTSWCVARSDASREALQAALDYACAYGADCTPLQRDGLCFLPNTIQAHASYAFNSYYQRRAMAPASCLFSGTATVAKSDPSYGSCVYPASLSAAGGAASTSSVTPATPVTNVPLAPPTLPMDSAPLTADNNSSPGFNSAGMNPPIPTSDVSTACFGFMVSKILVVTSFVFLMSFMF